MAPGALETFRIGFLVKFYLDSVRMSPGDWNRTVLPPVFPPGVPRRRFPRGGNLVPGALETFRIGFLVKFYFR